MFSELSGNERVKQLLRRMLEARRVPGAMLFSGESGVGKKLFALELARALNCRNPQGVEACGKCSSCVRIGKLNYPKSSEPDDWKTIIWTDHGDVGMVVAPKRVLVVEQMRHIEREAYFRPFEGNARVFLVEDADKLNDSSSNALLKTLEEPPPTSHLILLTARPAVLLPTIRSRCQAIRFAPLTVAEIEAHLKKNKLAPAGEAGLRARSAGGSLGRALAEDLRGYKASRQAMLTLLEAIALSDDRTVILRISEEMNDARNKEAGVYESKLDLLEALIRDAFVVAVGAPESQVVNEDVLPELKKLAAGVNSQRVTSWISQIEELREQLTVNVNRKVATDSLFLSLARS